MKKIIGYSHNWLVNHFEEIVTEQLQRLVNSGLYDATEVIYCGVIGSNENYDKFRELIKPYPKIKVAEYSTTPELFEFQTMDIIKSHADESKEDYYLWYIHTKGVSFARNHPNKKAYGGGTYWRRHMEKYTIDLWRDNVVELDKGYETCGTQMRVRDFPRHYSGSFWWARSEYIKILRPIQTLDLSDRIQSEFWIGSGEPIAATLSQEYVDYYTPAQGESSPPIPIKPSPFVGEVVKKKKVRTGRNIVHTLCWNTVSEVEISVRRLYQLNDRDDFIHVIVDLGFPIIKGDEIPNDFNKAKQKNSDALKLLAKKYGSDYIQIKNEGVSKNWTSVAKYFEITDDDVLICADPDERIHPKSLGWVNAIGDVMREDKTVAVVSLIMPEQVQNKSFNETNSVLKTIAGVNVYEVNGGAMWATCGLSGKFINHVGGVPEPNGWGIYGHLESACGFWMQKLGYNWCMLKDFVVKHTDNVPLLRAWKDDIIHGSFKEQKQIHFEEWLTLKREGKI